MQMGIQAIAPTSDSMEQTNVRAVADRIIGRCFVAYLQELLTCRHRFDDAVRALQHRFCLADEEMSETHDELVGVVLWRFAEALERGDRHLGWTECRRCGKRDVRFMTQVVASCCGCGSSDLRPIGPVSFREARTSQEARRSIGVLVTLWSRYVRRRGQLPHKEILELAWRSAR